ncbi:MAG: response regulator, partial [Solirubrobacterales bacterium]|nr:response regulator [Solirubrobacterales bacterium]
MSTDSVQARGRVLVVDDEPTIGDVVSRYLRRAGYQTHVALTGHDALEWAFRERPDVIVLDLMLPDTDGLEVMRRLRRREPLRTAFILLTARGE